MKFQSLVLSLALAGITVGCGSGGASGPPDRPDATPGDDDDPDASPGSPDASPGSPDAAPPIDADPTAPATVIATTPADDATGVEPGILIQATFSRDMDPATIDATTFQVSAGGASVAGTVSYDPASRVATFTPDPRLALLGAYTATITTGVTDAEGGALAAPATWSFEIRDGAWGAAKLLGGPDPHAPVPHVAIAGDGTAHVAWLQGTTIAVDRHVPGAGWAGPTVLGTASTISPVIAAADDGHAIALFASGIPFDLVARVYTPGEGWGAAQVLDSDELHHVGAPFDVRFDDEGNAIAVWGQQDSGAVWARRWTSSTGWETPARVGDGEDPRVAMGPDGTVLAAWTFSNDVRAAWFAPETGWEAPTTLGLGWRVRIGVDGDGNAIAVWLWDDDWINAFTSRFTPAGGWSATASLESGDGHVIHLELAVHPSGGAIAVWGQGGAGAVARDFAPATGWADPIPLDGPGSRDTSIAIDSAGNAIAVWARDEGDTSTAYASRRPAGAGWTEPVSIDVADSGDSYNTNVAVAPTGVGVAAWTRSIGPAQSGSDYRGWANIFD